MQVLDVGTAISEVCVIVVVEFVSVGLVGCWTDSLIYVFCYV
jgi:hypothetical protein